MRFSTDIRKIALLIVIIIAGATVESGYAQRTYWLNNGTFIIDNFEEDIPGQLPTGWYNREARQLLTEMGPEKRSNYHYKIIEKNGNKFLRYSGIKARHLNLPLQDRNKGNIYHINVYETPILSWKWRILNFPEGANIKDDDTNDAAASIYIVWDLGHVLFKKVPKTVRYVWGTSQPAGTEMSKFFGNQKIIVLKSGTEDKGKWVTFHRNIVKDYKRLFGDKPPKTPLAILIMSDGDSTHSYVKADYDDIKLMSAEYSGQ